MPRQQMPEREPHGAITIPAVQAIMRLSALTVMVFMRRDLGYRLLNPVHMACITGALAVISILAGPAHWHAQMQDLFWFAVVSFFLALWHRAKRLREIKRGLVIHSYYIGTSPFACAWLPKFCRRNRRMARFVDPLYCIALGFCIRLFSPALGTWILFTAFCLRYFEDAVREKERNIDLDVIDGLIESGVHTETVEKIETAPAQRQQPPAAIPTGLAPDIEEQVKRHAAKPKRKWF